MFNIVHDHSFGQAMQIVRETEKTPPLFFIFTWLSVKLGDPTYWIRLPSLLFGTALVPLGYVLGAQTVGRKAGLVAAAILTLDPFAIFYGTEARAYGALAFFAGLSTVLLLQALRSGKRAWWAAYALGVLAVLYAHYMGVFVVIVQAAWAMWTHRERLRTLIIVNGLIALAYLPWLPSFLVQERHSINEAHRIASFQPVSWHLFGQINIQVLMGQPFVSLGDLPGTVPVIVGVGVILAAALVAAGRAWRSRTWPALSSPVALLAMLTVASPIGVGLISLRPHESFLIARNVIASLVPAAVLIGWLLTSLPRRLATAAVATFLVVLVIGAELALQSANRRTPYRDVAHFIDAHAHARPGDPVLQVFFIPTLGPLARVIAINLSHPRPIFTNASAAPQAWALARRTGHDVFESVDLPGAFRALKHLPATAGPGNKFVRIAERRYIGLSTVIVAQYRYSR
jgi:uncharacterized membrane protein